ncbi:MAG: UvrD-helicase domain-containing protein, partial [Myxococcota bacterium]
MLPVDQSERIAVRDEHDVSVFVEAGAGTGKTTAIVARVVSMVATGWLALRELAAITFTEAAASELRDRIREALEAASDGRDELVTSNDERERCGRALHQLDEAALTTLHGFAQRILAEHPLEAGLPPGFDVLDPIRARVELEQRWAGFVDDTYADPALRAIILRGLSLGIGPDDLHAIALELNQHHDRLGEVVPTDPTPPPLSTDAIVRAFDALLAHRTNDCRNDEDLLAAHIDRRRTWRTLLDHARDDFDIIELLVEAPRVTFKHGQSKCWA